MTHNRVCGEHLRVVQGLSKGGALDHRLLKLCAGISSVGGDSQFERVSVLKFERLLEVLLGTDRNEFLLIVQVVELDQLLVQETVAECLPGLLQELLVGAGHFESFGLSSEGDFDHFFGLHFFG